jgi:hypothetical protein
MQLRQRQLNRRKSLIKLQKISKNVKLIKKKHWLLPPLLLKLLPLQV